MGVRISSSGLLLSFVYISSHIIMWNYTEPLIMAIVRQSGSRIFNFLHFYDVIITFLSHRHVVLGFMCCVQWKSYFWVVQTHLSVLQGCCTADYFILSARATETPVCQFGVVHQGSVLQSWFNISGISNVIRFEGDIPTLHECSIKGWSWLRHSSVCAACEVKRLWMTESISESSYK